MRESLVMSKSAPLSELLILDLEIESSFLLFSVIKKGGKKIKKELRKAHVEDLMEFVNGSCRYCIERERLLTR